MMSFKAAAGLLAAEGPVPHGIPRLDRVFLIMLEIHGCGQIIDDPNAPFINSLARSANQATGTPALESGGGSLMTPVLILFFGIPPAVAVGTDLLYASISKSFAVVLHSRHGSIDWRIVGLQAVGSVPAALSTLWLMHGYRDQAQLAHLIKLVLSGAILLTATFTLFQVSILRRLPGWWFVNACLTDTRRRSLTVLTGALIGAVVVISSVGAGVIGLMLLILLYPRVEPIRIVGVDLAHAVLITTIAGLGYAGFGTVDYGLLGMLLIGALPGVWLGSMLGLRMDAALLRRAIAGVLLFVGAGTLVKTIVG